MWVIGSSIIKWAFFRARRSLFRADLSIKRFNGRIFWQGKGGMSWKDLFLKVKLLKKYEQTPNIFIIHCGGNDIRKIKIKNIRETMKITYYKLKSLLPNTRFCWSSILPRTNWRYSKNTKALNFAVKRINSYMCNLFKVNGDSFIQHPQISWNLKNLSMKDGVHPSQRGNDLFLHNVQEHLDNLLNKNNVWREWATPMA